MDLITHLSTLPAFLVLITTIIVNAIFGLVVLTRTYRKAYGWYFAITMFGIVGWALGDALLLFSRDAGMIKYWAEVFYISPMLIPIFIWFFACSFPDNKPLKPWQIIVAVIPFTAELLMLLFGFNFVVKGITITNTLNLSTPRSPGFMLYGSFFSLFFIFTYITLWLKAKSTRGVSHAQIIYTFYGALVASVPALITNVSLPIMGVRNIIWMGPFFTFVFAAAVTVAIVRHRLFDIRGAIARSIAYLSSLIILASLYGFIVFGTAQYVFGLHFAVVVQVLISAATGVAALSFNALRRQFDHWTERIFYRDAYDPQAFFNDFNKALVSTIDLDELLTVTAKTVATHLKAQYCLIGVKDGTGIPRIMGTQQRSISAEDIQQMSRTTPHIHQTVIVTDDISLEQEHLRQLLLKYDIAVLARISDDIHKTHEGLGYIAIGPKKSGNSYTDTDSKVLEAAANELLIAIQNALRFEEIEQFNVTLQQRIDDATHRLRESNRKLKMLDETKDDFISMASHQLRTPLTSVKGYLSLVLDGDAGPIKDNQRKLLTQAFISSQRMVYLIADLLNVSRLKTGKFIIEPTPINLADVIQEEVSQLVETAQSRTLTMAYHKPAHFPVLMLDETKIRQVCMNFMDNAIYYTPAGGHIDVEVKELPKTIEFRVTDNGIGVPKDEAHHLFTKFYRAKNAQRARPDGTGLGLFMAQKVVVAQGGAVIFNSKEGQGSTFGFTFPKDKLQAPATPEAQK